MATFKCKMCGAPLQIVPGQTTCECDSCFSVQTLPRIDNDRRANLYDRANHFRRNNDFDKAAGIYEQILADDNTDAEAYWSLVLCRYGVEYVEDPATYKRVPTVNRAQYTSIFDDENYKQALEYADLSQKLLYEEEAKAINEIQKGILAISQKEEPFDVFICYKETDANGRRTQDSVLANDLYHQLKNEGFKVFFSRITLEDKLGTDYEPYIFAALNSAKVMVVLGTKPEYFNAVWVKNEWSRYLSLVKQSGGKKVLIPAYRDMDPYDLPEEFSHLQAQDMSKLGFMQDLIRGIKKITASDEPKATVKETVVVGNASNIAPLLKRAFMFLEDGEWSRADDFCEQVLNQDPENAQAYLGKLMAELHVRRQEDLPNCEQPFDNSNNYTKAVRFGDNDLSSALIGYVDHIKNAPLIAIYNSAVSEMNVADSESAYKDAAKKFKTIPGFQDADTLAEQCIDRAEVFRKDAIYRLAKAKMTEKRTNSYKIAAAKFKTISGFKDADALAELCLVKAEECQRKPLAVAAAIKAGPGVKAGPIQQEQMSITNQEANLSAQLSALTSQETSLTAQRAKFGIFAGKEKKQIDEELSLIAAKKREVSGDLSALAAKKLELEREIAKENSSAFELEAQNVSMQANAELTYSYEEAVKVYLSEPEVTHAVNTMIYPAMSSDSIAFGRYIQNKNGPIEPIEWQVLARKGDRVLLISRYALDCKKFNTSFTDVTWESCSLRKWLNETFLNTAFSESERAIIPSVTISADERPNCSTNPGNSTTDQVFLLSITEANEFFRSGNARQCKGTAYCYAQGAYKASDGNCCWWLRSRGHNSGYATGVTNLGSIYSRGSDVSNDDVAVRPALWIELE